ncbi:hypothetical protein IAG44_15495 [Streptomyces roseirectus]|uniref:Uncharacterized protein n=1 Tax=Streptomyces roseirectus TaxID=2768066 RepID=A0A7H0ID30_9ACTN|nr:hypothetical protein [Streptomyces roseirectus]QNP70696.1 hypothetical protein IAG44_15495 [Streptomyces roseirectus]
MPEISDDDWEKFLRESEAGTAASAPKEPSARARMVTARLREQEARGELPEGWRTGPSWRDTEARARRRRRLWTFVGIPVAAALAFVAMKPSVIPGDPFGTGSTGTTGDAAPLPLETAAPSGAPGAVDPEAPTQARPFAGSPALRWADGAAGIVTPPATAVKGFTKAQVQDLLTKTRTLLIDTNLDPATLRGERPETAAKVIDPLQKDVHKLLGPALRKADKKDDPLMLVSRFDPAEIRIAGTVVKTRGRMTVGAGKDGSAVVHADYTFVYPVVRASTPTADGDAEATRTIVRRVLDVELSDPARYRVTPGTVFIARNDMTSGNSECDRYDGWFHPSFRSDEPTGPTPSGPEEDPYDRSRELGGTGEEPCGTVSRV